MSYNTMLIKLVIYLVVEIITTIACMSTGLVVYFSILFSELNFVFVHLAVCVYVQMYRIKFNNILLQRTQSNFLFLKYKVFCSEDQKSR